MLRLTLHDLAVKLLLTYMERNKCDSSLHGSFSLVGRTVLQILLLNYETTHLVGEVSLGVAQPGRIDEKEN